MIESTAKKLEFEVHLVGRGVAPETVRASDLVYILERLETALVETARSYSLPIPNVDEAGFCLVGIEKGESSDLKFAVVASLGLALSGISDAIATGQYARLPFAAHQSLYDIGKRLSQRRIGFKIVADPTLKVQEAVISHEYPVPTPSAMSVNGRKTIWGRLIRIGGAEPKAWLRLRSGEIVAAEIDEAMVAQLSASRLVYKDIGLKGTATWRIHDMKLLRFKADELAGFHSSERPLTETFDQLADASQGRWASINPDEFVESLRHGDDQ